MRISLVFVFLFVNFSYAYNFAERDDWTDSAKKNSAKNFSFKKSKEEQFEDSQIQELMLAAAKGETKTIQDWLKKNRWEIDIQDSEGGTLLIYSARYGYTKTVEILIRWGADLDISNHYGSTALMWAAENGHADVVQLLVDESVGLDFQDRDGWTALMLASFFGHEEVVSLLIKEDANLNKINKYYRETALIWAVRNNRVKIVRMLVYAGANINFRDRAGWTAITIAEGNEELLKALREY